MGCILKGGGGLYSRLAVGAVLLAAGVGLAPGRAAEGLLELGGVPLIRRQLIALSGAGVDEVVVVLGHHAELIEPVVQNFPVTLVRNPRPTTARCRRSASACAALAGKLDAVIVALADQPLINAQDITALIGAFKKRPAGASVVVPQVGGEPGNPVIFSAEVREQILAGGADVGCRQWRARTPAGRGFRHRQPPLPRRHRHPGRPGALRARHRPRPALARRVGAVSAARLALARSVAWALLFGGWLALGAFGRQHLPLWAAGQVPVALWLAAVGTLLAVMRQRTIDTAVLRAALVGAGLLTAVALAAVSRGGGAAALLLAAGAWAALLVTVSFAVRSLRLAQAHTPPAPLAPALAGAALAWAATGDLGSAGATDLAALALAAPRCWRPG